MKAAVYERYGSPDILQIKEIKKPSPKNNEILIKIHTTTVTSGDCRVRSLRVPRGFGLMMRLVFGVTRPKQPILGTELSGVVEAVGNDVSKFDIGDAVFAFSDASMGCHAEYKCMPQDGAIALKPAHLTFDEAVALSFGATTALHFLKRGKLLGGESVLINGASGSVGTAAVQLAKHFGAIVTGVCSTTNMDLVQSLGADHVIDYTQEDFTKNGLTYDVIVDTVGTAPFFRSAASLKHKGRLLMVLASLPDMLLIPLIGMTSSKKVIAGTATSNFDDLNYIAALTEFGDFHAVIDRNYWLEDIADAHRYVDTGRKRGNVIISIV